MREIVRDELRSLLRSELRDALGIEGTVEPAIEAPVSARSALPVATPSSSVESVPGQAIESPTGAAPDADSGTGTDDGARSRAVTSSVPNGLPGGIFGRSVFLALDAAERAAYESLSPTQHSVWNAWVSGDKDAARLLDALDDTQRALTMTALGLEITEPRLNAAHNSR